LGGAAPPPRFLDSRIRARRRAGGYWLLSTLFSAGLAGSFLLVRRTPTGFGSARSPQLVWLLFGVYGVTAVGMLGRGLASASRSEVELFTKPLGFRAQFWLKSQARIRLRSTQESAPKKPTRYSVSWPDGIGGVAVTRLAAVAAYRPVLLAAGGAFLGGMFAIMSYTTRHAIAYTNRNQLVIQGEYITAGAVAFVLFVLARPPRPLALRAQIVLLWAVQAEGGGPAGAMQDPLGERRVALVRSQILLRVMARRLEWHSPATGPLPAAAILRAVGARIGEFLESEASLTGEVPPELRDTLLQVVEYIAGAADPADTLRRLSDRTGAFEDGRIKDAFRGPSRRFALRLLAMIPLRVSSTASFTKALGGIALIVVAMVLAATGHFLPQNAPAWLK
jgi:hypothetical protein